MTLALLIPLIFGRRPIIGPPSGTPIDSQDTLAFSVLTGIRAIAEMFSLERADEVYDRMMSGKARFRVVLATTQNNGRVLARPHERRNAVTRDSDRVLSRDEEIVRPPHYFYSDFPLVACPLKRNVFGSSPSPQTLNDPKSLYQGPSGASGSDSRHNFSL
jgi:hypothetical protein